MTKHRLSHKIAPTVTMVLTVCVSIQTFCPSIAFGQQSTGPAVSSRELLRPLEDWKRNLLMERHVYELAILEHFAKPGTFELYNFDVSVLRRENETITITLNQSDPIELLSHGIEVNPRFGGQIAIWRGQLIDPKSKRWSSVDMRLAIRAINQFGEIRRPDPSRENTRAELEKKNYTVLEESVRRLDEKIVYGIVSAVIQVPERNTRLAFRQLGEEQHSYGTVLVYEIDEDKIVLPGDDSPVNPTPPTSDMIRRSEAYKNHVDNVRRRFGLHPKEDY